MMMPLSPPTCCPSTSDHHPAHSTASTRALPFISGAFYRNLLLPCSASPRPSAATQLTSPVPLPPPGVEAMPEREEGLEGEDDDVILVKAEDDGEMLALVQQRRTDEAWDACEVAMKEGRMPSSAFLSRLLAQLSYQGTPSSLTRAQRVVLWLQRRKQVPLLDSNSLGLLAMATAKAGVARYSASIIRLMLKHGLSPHVKAWSAVISKLGKHREDVPLALSIFEEIYEHLNQEGNKETAEYANARPDTGAFNAVLNACSTAGLSWKANELFRELIAFGLKPDVLTFNIMIKLYALSGDTEKLATVLDDMDSAKVKPCQSTINSLVAAYVGLNDLERAVLLVKALKEVGKDVKSIVRNGMETAHHLDPMEVSHHQASTARSDDSFLDALNLRAGNSGQGNTGNLKPDTRTYSILMKGYMQKGRSNDVRRILTTMQNQTDIDCRPNEVTYTTAISTYVRLGLLDEARAILLEMRAHNVPAPVVTYNVLLSGYCKALQISKAQLLMTDMRNAGIQPDAVSYNTLIDGYISIEDSRSAMTIFTQMRNAGIAPTKISYTTLMKAFGLLGQPHLAAKVFQEMEQDSRVTVDVIACNTLIESYSKAGHVDGAKQSLQKMKRYGLMPTVATYGSLVKVLAVAGKPGDALLLWNEIKERLEAEEHGTAALRPDAGLLDGLVDMCVRAGFFQKALEIIACMEKYEIPADKIKYKRIFVELHSKLYTSKHASQARRDRTADRRRAVEAFKFWVGLPNDYYSSDWSGYRNE